MRAPGPDVWTYFRATRTQGFLEVVGELWREHGDVFQVRIGSRTVVFVMHPDAVVRISSTHRGLYEKKKIIEPLKKYALGNGLVTSNGDIWRRQRQLMAPFFTPKGIGEYAEAILQDGLRLRERWHGLARDAAEVEIGEEMAAVTASIILKALFSSQSPQSIRGIKQAAEVLLDFVVMKSTGLSLPLWFPSTRNRRYIAARALLRRNVAAIIAERRALSQEHWPRDLLARLMSARDEETGKTMSEGQLQDEALTLFIAGYETTARTLMFAWYALAANPRVAARLHEELDRELAGRVPTVEDLKRLPYTMRVIKEVLRLYPAGAFYGKDAVQSDEIGGFTVPRGASVILSPYYTHRHPDFWDRPEVFEPDRWLNEQAMHAGAFHPFSMGQRICIGKNLSLLESHVLLATLAQRFVPRMRPNYTAQLEMRGALGLAGGLPMTLTLREASAVRDSSAPGTRESPSDQGRRGPG